MELLYRLIPQKPGRPAFAQRSDQKYVYLFRQLISGKGKEMTTQDHSYDRDCSKTRVVHRGGAADAVYGLGFIGACVYYIGTATTFGLGVLGFLKSLVWPAFLVYEVLKYLNM